MGKHRREPEREPKHRHGVGLIPMGDRNREPNRGGMEDRGGPDAVNRGPVKPDKK